VESAVGLEPAEEFERSGYRQLPSTGSAADAIEDLVECANILLDLSANVPCGLGEEVARVRRGEPLRPGATSLGTGAMVGQIDAQETISIAPFLRSGDACGWL
jgi:hypothetical protein